MLEVEVKGKAQETVWKHFSAYLDDLRGPTGTRQGKAELAPPTLLKCFSLVIGSVKNILTKQALSDNL